MTDVSKGYATSNDVMWRYPSVDKPLKGVKLLLLNPGGCAVIGNWSNEMIAWLPLPRRDHKFEDSLKECV